MQTYSSLRLIHSPHLCLNLVMYGVLRALEGYINGIVQEIPGFGVFETVFPMVDCRFRGWSACRFPAFRLLSFWYRTIVGTAFQLPPRTRSYGLLLPCLVSRIFLDRPGVPQKALFVLSFLPGRMIGHPIDPQLPL